MVLHSASNRDPDECRGDDSGQIPQRYSGCGAELTSNPATEIRLIGSLSKRPIQIQRFRLFVLSVNTKNKLGGQAGWENARNAAWSLQNGKQKYGKRLGKKKFVAA